MSGTDAPTKSKIITGSDPARFFDITQEKLGRGAYGVVVKARRKSDGSAVAMKILEIQKDDHAGLREELQILANCNSPHTVNYVASFIKGDKFWIAMEYCEAGSVMDLMLTCRITLTEAEIASCMRDAISGLAYLHKRHVIHRDVKGANLLLTARGECKLADFGVSKQLVHTLARTKTLIGTPYWMAPEIVDSKARKAGGYNAKADIWSLGITAIEAAQGRPPLHDVFPMKAIFLIPKNPPPRLQDEEEWSDAFVSFLKSSLTKDFKTRPSASELLLHPFIKSAPDQKVVAQLVQRCMPQIETVRKLRAERGESDSDESSVSSSDRDRTTGTLFDTMMQTVSTNETEQTLDGTDTIQTIQTVQRATGTVIEPQYIKAMRLREEKEV